MTAHRLDLGLLDGTFAIARISSDAAIPAWVSGGPFSSVTRTADELSIACLQSQVPPGVRCDPAWRCLRVAGTLDLTMVGVLASLVGPLAEAGISVFVVSTFDTDYLLVKDRDLDRMVIRLRQHGHRIG